MGNGDGGSFVGPEVGYVTGARVLVAKGWEIDGPAEGLSVWAGFG